MAETPLRINLGIDDTDSERGGCTTHLGHLMVKEALDADASFLDYPALVRLNPDVPWKTRGNGAVSLRFYVEESAWPRLRERLVDLLEEYTRGVEGRESALVAISGRPTPGVERVYRHALHEEVSKGRAEDAVREAGGYVHYLGGGRGLVGATASVGASLVGIDHTYELLAYRSEEMYGKPRLLDESSLKEASKGRDLFSNVSQGKAIVAPHGDDPVLMGIRGESPEDVYSCFAETTTGEPVVGWTIFVSNQGTRAHLDETPHREVDEPYQQVVIRGCLTEDAESMPGGHVKLLLANGGEVEQCMVYEEAGLMAQVASQLREGDGVRVCGGVKPKDEGLTLNAEELEVLQLRSVREVGAVCPKCLLAMESMGKGQGRRCRNCGYRVPMDGRFYRSRRVEPELCLPPLDRSRHLTKPLSRRGRPNVREQADVVFRPWTSWLDG